MKKFLILFIGLFSLVSVYPQLDRTNAPEPGPAPVIQIGDYQTFTLSNGLKVIVVENHKTPVVSFQLTLNIDPVREYDAKGYISMAGSLMRTGTLNRTKAEIDEEIDFMGASISTQSRGIFASSLKRHTGKLLDLMSDILLNPVFPESELQREITQSKSSLAIVRSDASSMVSNVSSVLLYGADHPYGEIVTEETLSNITREMLQEYYNTYFRPNVAYMVIVGDITTDEARELMENYFAGWHAAAVPSHTWPEPSFPNGNIVAIANRPGAVQSVVSVTHPVFLQPGDADAIKVSVMNGILGGGVFSGRLIQNLREDKGYTYGARSNISSDQLAGRFNANTEVRNSVTDSTITEILYEISRLINEPVDQESLDLVKNFLNGSFARSLENPRTVANFALNIERYNLPEDYYSKYLENLSMVSVSDVAEMAAKYLKPANSYIVIGGNKEEVAPVLERFSHSGEVLEFDPFGRVIEKVQFELPTDLTGKAVIDNYIKAIGGESALKAIEDISTTMQASVQGMVIEMNIMKKRPDKFKATTSMAGNVVQQQVYDGTRGVSSGMQGRIELDDQMLEEIKIQALINPELSYEQLGYSMVFEGVENISGKPAYKVAIIRPSGQRSIDYFDIENGLRVRTLVTEETIADNMTLITDYSDYREVNGVLFPFTIKQQVGPQVIDLEVTEIKINTNLDSSLFTVN